MNTIEIKITIEGYDPIENEAVVVENVISAIRSQVESTSEGLVGGANHTTHVMVESDKFAQRWDVSEDEVTTV